MLLRLAHHDEVVGVTHERPESGAVTRPQRVEHVQVDV
jgi:hypothetical protein